MSEIQFKVNIYYKVEQPQSLYNGTKTIPAAHHSEIVLKSLPSPSIFSPSRFTTTRFGFWFDNFPIWRSIIPPDRPSESGVQRNEVERE